MLFRIHILIGIVLIVTGAFGVLEKVAPVYPAEGTKSRFLLQYDPSIVVRRLEMPVEMSTMASSGAGTHFPWERRNVEHKVEFQWYFRPGPTSYMEIVSALNQEAREALIASRAEIVSDYLGNGRFALTYRAGRTTGSIHADWQKLNAIHYLQITVTEKCS